jgi:hypothetical protein
MRNAEKEADFERIHGNRSKLVQGEVVHCKKCLGAYSLTSFHKHRKLCGDARAPLKPELLNERNSDYSTLVLNQFRRNEIGETCRKDDVIKKFGWLLFQKAKTKVDKVDEVVKSVMGDMRLIARIFCNLKLEVPDEVILNDASAVVTVAYWRYLKDVIDTLTSKDDRAAPVKHGLKMNIYYTLVKFADALIGDALENKQPTEDLEAFKKILKHHQNSFFGDAKYQINKLRQEALRLPERLPDEDYVIKLRDHTVNGIEQLTSKDPFDASDFIQLRNLTSTRLTLFNARRGGEAVRLTIDHWNKRHQWIRPDQKEKLDEEERRFFAEMEIMYSTGNHSKHTSKLFSLIFVLHFQAKVTSL